MNPASTITTASADAAMGVSIGAIPVAAGRISPSAPSNSAPPMNRTVGVEKSSTHGRLVISRSRGIVDFITPAIKKNAASTPCRIHSPTFIAYLALVLLVRGAVDDGFDSVDCSGGGCTGKGLEVR